MADFIYFSEGLNGANSLMSAGLPATCTFELSTKKVGTGLAGEHQDSDTHAGGYGLITGTGYSSKTEARPTPAARSVAFAAKVWATGAATDWSNSVKSIVLRDATNSKLICAWNLIAGGAARDLSQANTTETVTPTLGPLASP